MRTGSYPFFETTNKNSQYNKIIRGEYDAFWAAHEKQKKLPEGYFSKEFKELLNFLFCHEPVVRMTMADIISHPWMDTASLPKSQALQAHFGEIMNANNDQLIVA